MFIRQLRRIALLAATLGLALTAGAATTRLTGTITDSMCGLHHMMKGNPAKCTRDCVKSGSHFALAVHGRVIVLQPENAAARSALSRYAARRVTLFGSYSGKIFEVSRVVKAGK